MEQKWENEARLRETLKKIEGLPDEDINSLFELADATGMPITDDLLPFFATMLSLRREGKNTTAEMKAAVSDQKELLENFRQHSSMMLELEREAKSNFIEELDSRGAQELDLAKIKLEAVTKEVVGDTVQSLSAELQEKMATALDESRRLEREQFAKEWQANEADSRRKDTRLWASITGGVAALMIVGGTMVYATGYVNGRDNAQVIASELASWAKLPNSRPLLEILKTADPAVITQKCDRGGGKIIDDLGMCEVTIVKDRGVSRYASNTPVLDQVEVWFKRGHWGWLVALGAFGALIARKLAQRFVRNRWVSWALDI